MPAASDPDEPRSPRRPRAEEHREPSPIRALGRPEHSLFSLVELSRTLWDGRDVHESADALILNLMGQIGTPQAALWLNSEAGGGEPVLIRCHGIDRSLARAVIAASWSELSDCFRTSARPVAPGEIKGSIGPSTVSLAREARIALFAPLEAGEAPAGVVALGLPIGRDSYGKLELEVLEASLSIAGLAIRSARLQSAAAETSRKLRRANEELRELGRMKSEFIANVSHELRTPLTVVLGSLQCLSEGNLIQEGAGFLVEGAARGARGMLQLVERLLTLSDVARGGLVLNPTELDLTAFLTAYHEERRPGVSVGLRELHLECNSGALRTRLDGARLRQVLDELVDNAIKFSLEGSNIWLQLTAESEHGMPWAGISVRDEGVGIPADRLPGVFQSFHQLDGSSTRTAGGLGIGLVAAKQIAEAMGGRLTLMSQDGQGSEFAVVLPLVAE